MITETKQIRVLLLACAVLTLWQGSAAAQAENPRVFVNVDIGGQVHSHTFSSSGSMEVYTPPGFVPERAAFESTQGVSGGLLADFGAAYQVRPRVAVGVSVSTVGDTEDATIVASVPDPIFTDQPATATGEQNDLGRRETTFHIQAKLTIPTGAYLPEGGWVAFVIGPSFFHLSQDLIGSITVPDGTQNVVPVVESQSGSGAGVNVGIEGRYPLREYSGIDVGIGGFIRYAGAKVDLDAAQDVKVGGLQAAVGVNLAF